IGSDKKGKLSSVAVTTNAAFGFAANASASGASVVANDVGDLNKVTADEINALLVAAAIPVPARFPPPYGKLVLPTRATGKATTRAAKAGPGQIAFGLDTNAATGKDGDTVTYHVKRGTGWRDSGGNALDLSGLLPGATPNNKPADFITINVVV